ncbi:MAG TPA: hypothetical protein VJK05_05290 [archaeon]|nr:hypothetical protein [archaeon]
MKEKTGLLFFLLLIGLIIIFAVLLIYFFDASGLFAPILNFYSSISSKEALQNAFNGIN